MKTNIREITVEEVLKIRQKVMWPNKSIDYVKISNDKDGRHFGLFIDQELISVISLFTKNNIAQFRKFATEKKHQGKGFGSILLNKIIAIVIDEKTDKIWCNARIEKLEFYQKFGMKPTTNRFTKGGIEYIIMEKEFEYKP